MYTRQDLRTFTKSVVGFGLPIEKYITVEQPFDPTGEFRTTFPQLTTLLEKARRYSFKQGDKDYILNEWDNIEEEVCGWLTIVDMPLSHGERLIPEHELLLKAMGGIKETFNPAGDSLTSNQNVIFGRSMDRTGDDWKDYYFDMCLDAGSTPVDYSDFIIFAWEANGNFTLYDPATRKVFLFAHDHNFKNVTPLEGQPAYTLYTINGVVNFVDYVEQIASEWLAFVE